MGIEIAFIGTAVAILITMSLAMIRAMAGPTVFDRVLALNMFGTKTVLLICVVCFAMKPERQDFLDLALLYSLMNFIGMVALLRFSQFGGFDARAGEDENAGHAHVNNGNVNSGDR
jgi:multicomponent Na+:H+ antiporter subunit F